MKPEVNKIFDDLEAWLDYCRLNLLKYDEKDLYKSQEYKAWSKNKNQKFQLTKQKKYKNG